MDVADHLRLREGEEVAVVQQILGCVLEAISANVGFLHAVGADRRAHRSVDNGDSTLDDLFKRMLLDFRHVFLMVLSVAMSAKANITPSCGFLTSTRRAGHAEKSLNGVRRNSSRAPAVLRSVCAIRPKPHALGRN